MPNAPKNLREFPSLLKVVEELRGPDGCPWDKEQTHSTLTRYAIEEAFELSEAIDSGESVAICDELGDVLLQVVLHAEIARQESRFDIHDVIQNLNEKMIRRHPHVFADTKADTAAEVLTNWAAIKAQEKGRANAAELLDHDIPVGLPALIRSQKIGERTKRQNFDWENASACWPKIEEEVKELKDALNENGGSDRDAIAAELGDVLFSVAQLARHLNMDSEQCLRQANRRFCQRFAATRVLATEEGLNWASAPAADRERLWKKAKKSAAHPHGQPDN